MPAAAVGYASSVDRIAVYKSKPTNSVLQCLFGFRTSCSSWSGFSGGLSATDERRTVPHFHSDFPSSIKPSPRLYHLCFGVIPERTGMDSTEKMKYCRTLKVGKLSPFPLVLCLEHSKFFLCYTLHACTREIPSNFDVMIP